MTREERRRILSDAELADAREQAERALATVGIPAGLLDTLRPSLAPAAEALTEDPPARPAAA